MIKMEPKRNDNLLPAIYVKQEPFMERLSDLYWLYLITWMKLEAVLNEIRMNEEL